MLPTGVPARALVKLAKKCISIDGRDATKFLNGLLTVKPPMSETLDPVGSFAALLNSKGRVIADLFLYSVPHIKQFGSEYLLEVDEAIYERVLNQLDFYKLASEVEIKETNIKTHFFWDDEGGSPEGSSALGVQFADFRVPSLGQRILSFDDLKTTDSALSYQVRRYLFGIPEGAAEFTPAKALPLEYNLDFLNGVDFDKGCYVGQELTIRTHHHGVVRKRVVPVVLGELTEDIYEPREFNATGSAIQDASPVPNSEQIASNPFGSVASTRPAGSIIGAIGNVGLASMRIDTLGHKFHLPNGTPIHPMMPFWWPESSTN